MLSINYVNDNFREIMNILGQVEQFIG